MEQLTKHTKKSPQTPDTKQSRPEKIGQWLFTTTSNWGTVLAFGLVAALTFISIRFNIELGKLSAIDETSKQLLPTGYALLDLAALVLVEFESLGSGGFHHVSGLSASNRPTQCSN
jgi:hypothetical protein